MNDRTVKKPDTDNLPGIIPILPLYDAVLFPKMVLPLVVMQQDSIQLVDEAMQSDRIDWAPGLQKSFPGEQPQTE